MIIYDGAVRLASLQVSVPLSKVESDTVAHSYTWHETSEQGLRWLSEVSCCVWPRTTVGDLFN